VQKDYFKEEEVYQGNEASIIIQSIIKHQSSSITPI
jgi:hypothetical protein